MDNTKIEWTDATWNPIRGCSRVSEGCRNCYAERVAARFSDGPMYIESKRTKAMPYHGLAIITKEGPRWTGEVRLIEDKILDPLRWKRPRRVFVNSMSDLFHEKVPDAWIDRIFAVMARAPQHTFQILTKRPQRMTEYLNAYDAPDRKHHAYPSAFVRVSKLIPVPVAPPWPAFKWPLPNVWLGVSVEDQKTADERIPLLLQTPAAVRWISAEPLIAPIDLAFKDDRELDWVVVGGESGPGARPCDVQWIRNIVGTCGLLEMSVFVKQIGAKPYQSPHRSGSTGYFLSIKDKKGGDMAEWPQDLRVREFPR